MVKNFFKVMTVLTVTGFLGTGVMAQQETEKTKTVTDNNNEEIIILKKGDKDTKVTVEIKGDDVLINGKPLAEFKDDNVVVSKRKRSMTYAYSIPRSPFRGGNMNFNDSSFGNVRINGLFMNLNKALLGVTTEKSDNGIKVISVTKGSAAEKAGFKENDIITKVDETAVSSPEDLTKAIGKFKPEDKTVISYKRDGKDMKATVLLGKRTDGLTLGQSDDMLRNFDFDMARPRIEGFNMARGGSPRLGIKAQDTEEGKGVKVLDVDDASNAQKAGIKVGDIITEFDGKTVNSANELADAARVAKDKSSIKVKYSRGGKSQEMEIKIPKKLKTANL